MDSRNMSFGGESIDWADPAFSSSEFQDSMTAESPWGNSALNDFTNLAEYGNSPADFNLRTPSKSGPDAASAAAGAQQPQYGMTAPSSMSPESSTQDSSSDSSSRRKRKTTSESPGSNPAAEMGYQHSDAMKQEPTADMNSYQSRKTYEQAFNQPLPNLAVNQSMSNNNNDGMFDFSSAASSPNFSRDFNQQLSLDAKMNIPASTRAPQFEQDSPLRTINPGMFTIGGSRDQSPQTNNAMFNTASPNAIFSTPSSDSNETFNPNWNPNLGQNPAWPADFSSQFASPGGLGFTPSPMANGATPSMVSRATPSRTGRSPLHIAPISAKSRVETQINVIMTMERPPPGIEHLHLPLHTIAKSKLLAKEEYDRKKVLELHTMLVCSSAMHNPMLKEKALARAASQNNEDIQRKADQHREESDEEKNDMKNVDEADKPANGGEVRICNNCIQRERKRAGRKKLKKEEEQQHWERYETERVVVFNSNEYLPFKPFEQSQQPQKDAGTGMDDPYIPPEGAVSAAAAMRIACYCRHQSEKEGFQVIFTMKDHNGNVVAQEMSDSILITDDHKTHPPALTTMSSDVLFHPAQFQPNGLPTSYSMMDLASHAQPFTSSRSTGNLQALAYGQQSQFNPHSHIHQLPNNGFVSQATSATMTPTSLSRPGSPTSAGQAGPNKKRKSSSFHKRVQSGLTMTPRIDTSQQPSASIATGVSMGSAFSPTSASFAQQNEQSYMTIPNNSGAAQYFGSGPPTPANDSSQFAFGQHHQRDLSRPQNASAYFSHPSSAVPSRSASPVLSHSRPNMAAYARQPIQTPTNQLGRGPPVYGGQAASSLGSSENDQAVTATITKITPNEGPIIGGTEVSIFGYNFTHGTQVMFGESIAPTTFYGSQSILAISPPGRRGNVRVKLVPQPGHAQFASQQSNLPVFTYTDTNPQMMEMALRFLSQQQTGDPGRWMQYTTEVANQFMQTSISPAGIQGQGYGGGNLVIAAPPDVEDVVLKVFDLVDVSDIPREPCYDLPTDNGETMLSLASALGMHRIVAALLARGANPDVHDKGGFTPLMQAALHGRANTFQLLLVKGADPVLRSLKGYAALDLAAADEREHYLQMLQNTRRCRSSRPSLSPRLSFGSSTLSQCSWDIASASLYESELDQSEHTASMPPSRRPSANVFLPTVPEQMPQSNMVAPSPAMIAWRNALATQMCHLQQSIPSFQLPVLQHLPDHYDSAMVRRLSSLVPGRCCTRPLADGVAVVIEPQRPHSPSRLWDMFSSSAPATSVPPPAYSELFPEDERTPSEECKKRAAFHATVVDTVADERRVTLLRSSPTVALESPSGFAVSTQPKMTEDTTFPLWLWVSILVILILVVMQIVLPYITMIPMTSLNHALDQIWSMVR